MKNIITYHLVDKDYYPVMAVVGEDLCRNIVRGLQDVYTAQYIVRPDWDAIEFKTKDTLIYFLNPLASDVYLNKK